MPTGAVEDGRRPRGQHSVLVVFDAAQPCYGLADSLTVALDAINSELLLEVLFELVEELHELVPRRLGRFGHQSSYKFLEILDTFG